MPSQEQKFSGLLETHGRMLSHLVCGYEANPAVQEELFQDIALAIWTALPGYRGDSSEKTFIARIAQNRLARHVDKAVKRVKTETLEPNLHDIHGGCGNFDEQMATDQRVSLLLSAIRGLPLDERHLLSLALEGFSYQEIADVLGMTVNHIGVKLNRAKARLKTKMEAMV